MTAFFGYKKKKNVWGQIQRQKMNLDKLENKPAGESSALEKPENRPSGESNAMENDKRAHNALKNDKGEEGCDNAKR